jgi:hypothetical protein
MAERCMTYCAAPTQTSVSTTTPQTQLTGSPKEQQMRAERAYANIVVTKPTPGYETAGYRPTGSDGITASPRVRAQLDERPQSVQIAPLK